MVKNKNKKIKEQMVEKQIESTTVGQTQPQEEPIVEVSETEILTTKVAELEAEQNADGFWNDVQNAQKVSKEISQIKAKLERFEKLLGELDDAVEIVDIVELEASEEEDLALQKTVERLQGQVEKLTLETLLSGKYDGLNAILTLHAGAGGLQHISLAV